MEQNELRQWEQRCIQEEPPECTAACPLHVDVRGLIGHIRDGRWHDGWRTLARTMPLAGILGRICDAPCEMHCKRNAAGAAIRIGALERACVQQSQNSYRVTPLPAKNKKVAVLGSALSSLTVAWDMIRKGYAVTVFAAGDQPGSVLERRYPDLLTSETVRTELSWLERWGVRFETGKQIHSETFDQARERFDAFYIGLDNDLGMAWDLDRNADGSLYFEPRTHTTRRPEVFAGGAGISAIGQAAQGRWAATTMDRWLQKVSLTAGREKEGPCATRLYTSLVGVTPRPAESMADPRGYSADEALAEAQRCLSCECLECVKVCPYLESFGAYPRKYAREIYNNAAIVMGARTANALINSCSLCGLCATVCPEDFGMHELCQPARKDMVRQGKMPPSAHEFALQDMAFSLGDDFFMARHASATRRSSHLFFPGCQLCASSPGQVEDVYGHLCSTIEGGVGLMLGCCGAPAYWAGRQEDFDQILAVWQQQWESLGQPPLILACATCYQMFQTHWPAVPIQSLWETLERVGLPTKNRYVPSGPLAVHDPCTTRAVPAVQAAVRRLLKVLGVETTELPLGRATTECCGYGGLMQNANPSLAREVVRRRAALSSHDYLAYCAMCRDNLAQGGKRALHLLDLLFADPQYPDPAARPRPGWSPRRENRARLKAALLEKHWQQAPSAVQAYRSIILRIAPTVQERLEERRILAEDLKQTIAYAEAGGPKLRHPDTGRFRAAFRPRHVTFWVEYAPDGHAFIVYNAYAHRMEVSRS